MKRLVALGFVLGVVACAPKKENPELIGVTFDRLYEEGWQAYTQGDYATAEAKFDSILKVVDATRPEVYLALALSQVPQRKTSQAEANVSLALALIGAPYATVEHLTPAEILDLNPATTRVGFRSSGAFLPVSGFSGGSGDYWFLDLVLADIPGRSQDSAFANGQVPLGFADEHVKFRLLGWDSDTVFLELGTASGSPHSSVTLVNPSDTVAVVYDTVYNVPGEGTVVETLVVLGTVNVQKVATTPDLQDQLSGGFLVRDASTVPSSALTDLHILAYLVLSANALIAGGQSPSEYLSAISYAIAASQLIQERGQSFAYEPLPGMALPQFQGCWAHVLEAKAAFSAEMYYNAALAVNAILVSAGEQPVTPSFFLTASELDTLSQKIGQAEAICVAQTTGGL